MQIERPVTDQFRKSTIMDEIRTEKRSVRGAFFSNVILAILYPLSIAPVQWLMYRSTLPYRYWR